MRDTEWNEKHRHHQNIIHRVAFTYLGFAATMHNVLLDSLMNVILSVRVERTKMYTHYLILSVCECMMHKT